MRSLAIFSSSQIRTAQTVLTAHTFSGYKDEKGLQTNPYQPFPHFNGFSYTAYDGASNYNSLQAKLEKRLTNGLSFLTTYTWAHSLDNADTPLGSTNDEGTRSVNILGLRADYGPSGFDVRQRFTFNGNYELPVGRGRKYLNNGGALDYLIGGWSSSFVFRAQTGQPLTIGTNGITTVGGASVNAIRVGDPYKAGGSPADSSTGVTSCPTKVRTIQNWYNPCAFKNPLADNLGNTGAFFSDGTTPIPNTVSGQAAFAYVGSNRGQVYGPGYERMDSSLFKSFPTFREQSLQFRADIFNVLNTPAYGNPSTNNISDTGGQISSARFFQANTPDSRFFQFALKYLF